MAKSVGIVGGLGPESTIEYYRLILSEYSRRSPGAEAPSVVIVSLDLEKGRGLVERGQYAELTSYLLEAVQRLARAGCDFGALAANTPHIVFDDLSRQSPVPLLSLVEATCKAAKASGMNRLGLLGTRFTMQHSFYPEVFSRQGMVLSTPEAAEQDYIHEKYFAELVQHDIRAETRERMRDIVERMKDRVPLDGLILGGTELSLIFRESAVAGLPVLDTTRIHVDAIVSRLLE
jgi:aspartate racemase